MIDKKFTIAVAVIIILVLVIVGMFFVKPQLENYIIQKQIEAQVAAVNAIIDIVNQQGYVTLGEGETQIVLIKYQEPQQ